LRRVRERPPKDLKVLFPGVAKSWTDSLSLVLLSNLLLFNPK
jgi:hypothetical protein